MVLKLLQSVNPYETIKFLFELAVLGLIFREIREMKKHRKALARHEEHLDAVRPLYSTLYTSSEEIMNLAVTFTKEAKEVYALGSIESLLETERQPNETQSDLRNRHAKCSPQKLAYVKMITDRVLAGAKYCRVMDFKPIEGDDESRLEILANVNFFIRLLEFQGSASVNLELYHNAEILRSRGDFHFRCSDRQVVLRVGGHGNQQANAAISITDTKVVHEFQQYYQSLVHSPLSRRLDLQQLTEIREILIGGTIDQVSEYLAQPAEATQ
jgi:hypothetical protein